MPKRLGITAGFAAGPAERENFIARLQVADDLGLDSIWVAEAWGRDAFTLLTQLALKTKRAQLATGIVNGFSRSPAVLAMNFGALDELSGGRMVIGLGSSGANVIEHLHGAPFQQPLRRLREYVEIINMLMRQEPLNYEGQVFKLSRGFRLQFTPVRPHIPVYIAAITPRSIRQTGEIADGLIPIHWPKQKYQELRDQLHESARRAGREDARIEIASSIGLFITDGNEEAVRRRAREPLAYYIGRMGRFYYEMLQRHGYEEEVAAVRSAWERRDAAAAAAAVSDRMLEDIPVVGPLDACAEKLDELRFLGVDVPLVSLPPGDPQQTGRILERLMR